MGPEEDRIHSREEDRIHQLRQRRGAAVSVEKISSLLELLTLFERGKR
jgi:hypothetical protein